MIFEHQVRIISRDLQQILFLHDFSELIIIKKFHFSLRYEYSARYREDSFVDT